MWKVSKAIVFFLLFVMLSVGQVAAQKPKSVEKQQKEFFKKEEERKKDEALAEKEGLKKHMEIQDKNTQKRMKKNRKHSERMAVNKREPFWNRWFVKKGK